VKPEVTDIPPAGPRAQPGYISTLKNRDFAVIWLGQAVSSMGDGMHRIAVMWVVSEITGSHVAVGGVFFFSALPLLLVGLFAGAAADQLNRKRLMIWSDIGRAVLVMTIPILLWTDNFNYWVIVFATFGVSLLSLFFRPAMKASIPNIVGRSHLLTANSLNEISLQIATIVGHTLGGLVVATSGGTTAFALNSLTFLISALAISLARIPGTKIQESKRKVELKMILLGIPEGFRFIFAFPLLLSLVSAMLLLNFFAGPTQVLANAQVAENWTDTGAVGLGLLMSAMSGGAMVGAFVVRYAVLWIRRHQLIVLSTAVVGISYILAGLAPTLQVGLLAFALLGLALPMINIPLITWEQEIVPDHLRGRVFAAIEVGCDSLRAPSFLAGGWAAQVFGPSPTFAVCGSAFLAAALFIRRACQVYGGLEAAAPTSEAAAGFTAPEV